MELKLIEHNEACENNVKYQNDCYTIGNYKIIKEIAIYESGKTVEQFEIRKNREKDFLPDIYCNPRFSKGKIEGFKIQTTSYGSLSPAEIQEVIDGYQETLEVVNILTDKFIK